MRRRFTPAEIYLGAVVVGIVLAAAVALLIERAAGPSERLPDFSRIENTVEKKQAFFDYLLPFIHAENSRMMEQRARVLEYQQRYVERGKLSKREQRWLERLYAEMGFEEAEIGSKDFFKNLLSRVDAIPPSLALAQAANESGWGSSRFAREGNNLYGIWCYTPGCGLVPRRRPAGATYEVAKYRSVADSVTDYVRSINTNDAYLPLRLIRVRLRDQGQPITGTRLANGLERYSERGMAYVRDIQSMIQANNLERYDV